MSSRCATVAIAGWFVPMRRIILCHESSELIELTEMKKSR